MRRSRLTAAGLAAALAAATVSIAAPVNGAGNGSENVGDSGAGCAVDQCRVGVGVRVPGSRNTSSPRGSGSSAPQLYCLYFGSVDATDLPAMSLESFMPGDTVWVRCWSDAGYTVAYGSAWSITWNAATDPGVPGVAVEDVAQWAAEQLQLPKPAPAFNPSGTQVVRLPTWLSVESWVPVSQTATAGGVSATVTATPWRQRWSFGADGATTTCYGPGTRYDPSRPDGEQFTDCSATFTHTSRGQPGGVFTMTVTVDWQVAWTSTVPGRGGDLGVLSTTSTRSVAAGEIQVLNS
jgi:hypothetical protein